MLYEVITHVVGNARAAEDRTGAAVTAAHVLIDDADAFDAAVV